jgi:hypothetical protein
MSEWFERQKKLDKLKAILYTLRRRKNVENVSHRLG